MKKWHMGEGGETATVGEICRNNTEGGCKMNPLISTRVCRGECSCVGLIGVEVR